MFGNQNSNGKMRCYIVKRGPNDAVSNHRSEQLSALFSTASEKKKTIGLLVLKSNASARAVYRLKLHPNYNPDPLSPSEDL